MHTFLWREKAAELGRDSVRLQTVIAAAGNSSQNLPPLSAGPRSGGGPADVAAAVVKTAESRHHLAALTSASASLPGHWGVAASSLLIGSPDLSLRLDVTGSHSCVPHQALPTPRLVDLGKAPRVLRRLPAWPADPQRLLWHLQQ